MPSPTHIPGRIRNTAADHHMEGLAHEALNNGGIHLRFTIEEFGSREETKRLAKRFQASFGVYRARARRRGFKIEAQMGHDPNPLTYDGPYDTIEAQVHETENGHEVRLVLAGDLYKGVIITDTGGNPLNLEREPLPPKMVEPSGKRMGVEEVLASLKSGLSQTKSPEESN